MNPLATSSPEQQETPRPQNKNNELKIFLQSLAKNHERFCAECKGLISNALSLTENNAGTDYQATPAADVRNSRGELYYDREQQSKI
ncbi:hypothetical protein BH18THE2_BH18THE2_27560 [soil metagenome]